MAGDISRMLKQRVRRRLGDLDSTMFTQNEIYMWLSEAIRDIVSRVPDMTIPEYCVTKTWGGNTTNDVMTAGVSYYDLPDDFLRERGLTWGDDDVWATRIPLEDVARIEDLWNQGDNEPYYYIWKGRIYLLVGTVGDDDEFTFYYVKEPQEYIVDANTSGTESSESLKVEGSESIDVNTDPIIPRYYFRAMEDYAVARCLEGRGAWDRAGILMGDYEQSLVDVVARYLNNVMPADHKPSEGIGLGRKT